MTAVRGRRGPAEPVYLAIMERVAVRIREMGLTMLEVDRRAGLQSGYVAKCIHASMPSGRQARWPILQAVLDTLWPEGIDVVIRGKNDPARESMPAIAGMVQESRATSARIAVLRTRDQMLKMQRAGGSARMSNLTREQRRALARKAAAKRWKRARRATRSTVRT